MTTGQLTLTVDVQIEFLDADGNITGNEHTITDLVMPNGARVFSYRDIPVGEFLILKTSDGRFESPAVVKAVQLGPDRIPRLVLEFTGTTWQRHWIYPGGAKETPESYYDILSQHSNETCILLQIIIADLESGQSPDQVFLSELKNSVDDLRTLIFRLQKSINDN